LRAEYPGARHFLTFQGARRAEGCVAFIDNGVQSIPRSVCQRALAATWEKSDIWHPALLETDDAEVCSTRALQDCHDALFFSAIAVTIGRWFLPKSVNLRLTACFDKPA